MHAITLYRNDPAFGTVEAEPVYSWDDLVWFLQDSAETIESPPYNADDPAAEKRAKAKLPAFGPHRLVAGAKRARMGVVAVTLLAADIDHATQDEVDGIAERAAGRAVIVYGSPRDGMNGERRVRVVGLPSREMTPAESDRARIAFAQALGFDVKRHGVDQALGPERLFFVGRMAGQDPREFGVLAGAPWDVDALIASAPAPLAIVKAGSSSKSEGRVAKIRSILDALGDHHEHIGRRSNLCDAIGGLLRRDGATESFCKELVETWLEGACEEQNDKDAIKRGVIRATAAWKKAPHEVTGADAFAALLDSQEHAERVVDAIRRATGVAQLMQRPTTPEPVGEPIAPANTPLVLDTDKQGRPLRTTDNVCLCLEAWFADRIRFETTRGRIVCGEIDASYGRFPAGPWTTNHTVELVRLCERNGLYVKKTEVDDALGTHAAKYAYNAIADWLVQCANEWDGVARIDSALSDLWGCEASPATTIASRVLFMSLAARGLMPGCKVDTCVTFIGEQGLRKSSSWRALIGDEWFSDSDLKSKNESVRMMRGKWLWEFGEGVGLSKRERNERKQFITEQIGNDRGLWEKYFEDVPRTCVFLTTTNDDEILDDPTGNRRFPVVRVIGPSALAKIRALRVQLMGEAAARVIRGEVEYPDPDTRPAEFRWWPDASEDKVLDEVRADHVVTDVWDEMILKFAEAQTEPFSLAEALAACGQLIPKVTRKEEIRVANILRRLGFRHRKNRHGLKRWSR